MNKKIRAVGAGALVALWAVLTALGWFAPPTEMSDAERRELAQWPGITVQTLLDGTFMTDFEDYTLDQFPLRDRFRQIKSLFSYNVLNQKDNNQIYIADGYAAQMEYPLNQESVDHALKQFALVYNRYLKNSDAKIYTTVVPDKGYYLAEGNGYLALDYEAMFAQVQQGMPWAEYVDLTDCLSIGSYYYTDTHWRQECLLPTAKKLAQAMDLTVHQEEDFVKTLLDQPFYGVYYGQAALPMKAEPLYILTNRMLDECTVYNYVTGKNARVYDMEKLYGKDPYEVFLSGSQSLLRIDNPNAKTDRELIIFRDSFASSLAPLLVQDYKTVTLVDIRYISPLVLGNFIEFSNQDVLFMHSTLVLNKNLI